MRSIKCYSDIFSAHCWFAFETLLKEQPIKNYKLEFIPVHAASIMSSIGHKMPYYEKLLRDHNFYDIQLLGKYYGLDIRIPCNAIEKLSNIGTFNTMRLIVATNELDEDRSTDVWRYLYKRLWTDDKSISNIEDVEEVVNELNISKTVLENYNDNKWSEIIKKNNKEAIELGCFGVPWIKATEDNGDFECFFGNDRIPLIWKYLN